MLLLLLIKGYKLSELCLRRLWLEARGQHALLALGAERDLRLCKSQSPACTAAGAALEPGEAQCGPGGAELARGSGVFGRAPETRRPVCLSGCPSSCAASSGSLGLGRRGGNPPFVPWGGLVGKGCLRVLVSRACPSPAHLCFTLCLLYLKDKEWESP